MDSVYLNQTYRVSTKRFCNSLHLNNPLFSLLHQQFSPKSNKSRTRVFAPFPSTATHTHTRTDTHTHTHTHTRGKEKKKEIIRKQKKKQVTLDQHDRLY